MNDQKANGKNSEEPVNPGRRKAILASGLGVAAAAGSTIGAVPSSMAETRRDMDGKTALITGGARGIGLAAYSIYVGRLSSICRDLIVRYLVTWTLGFESAYSRHLQRNLVWIGFRLLFGFAAKISSLIGQENLKIRGRGSRGQGS